MSTFFVDASDCVKVAHLSNDDNVQQEQETEKDGVRQKKVREMEE